MDEQPAHNHRTRDIKQDGSCPACLALLARQHGSLAAAEAERRDWLAQAAGPEHEAGPGGRDDRDLQDGAEGSDAPAG
jgi:hypothetical protein